MSELGQDGNKWISKRIMNHEANCKRISSALPKLLFEIQLHDLNLLSQEKATINALLMVNNSGGPQLPHTSHPTLRATRTRTYAQSPYSKSFGRPVLTGRPKFGRTPRKQAVSSSCCISFGQHIIRVDLLLAREDPLY